MNARHTNSLQQRRGSTARTHRRSGTAAVEFAICLPVLLTLVLGSIEIANVVHLKQACTVAAYETALKATSRGAAQSDALARGNEVLTAFNVSGATINITPSVSIQTQAGVNVVVTVSAPVAPNSANAAMFFHRARISAQTYMVRL